MITDTRLNILIEYQYEAACALPLLREIADGDSRVILDDGQDMHLYHTDCILPAILRQFQPMTANLPALAFCCVVKILNNMCLAVLALLHAKHCSATPPCRKPDSVTIAVPSSRHPFFAIFIKVSQWRSYAFPAVSANDCKSADGGFCHIVKLLNNMCLVALLLFSRVILDDGQDMHLYHTD